jgi:YidC/Oxa1 family membrane protein insertase
MTQNSFGIAGQNPGPDIKRLLLAVVLMTGVLMLYNAFFAPRIVPEQNSGVVAEKSTTPKVLEGKIVEEEGKEIVAAAGIIATANNLPLVTKAFSMSMPHVRGNEASIAARSGYHTLVSNQGAQLQNFQLTGYKTPIELGATHAGINLFAVASRNANLTLSKNARYEVVSSDQDHVVLQHMTPQGVRVLRHYRFLPNQFSIEHGIELRNESTQKRSVSIDFFMNTKEPGTGKKASFFSAGDEETSVVWQGVKDREKVTATDLEKGKIFKGAAKYVGFDKRYFLVALIPEVASSIESTSASLWEISVGAKKDKEKGVLLTLHQKPVELLPGSATKLEFSSYLGPKQLTLLTQAGNGLDENIDFGWFGVLSRPMLWLLGQIFGFVGNFGVAIILLTLLIKLLTFPLTQKSFVSMQQMKKIAPEMKELQKKYSHDRAQLGQKQMELYKEKGINPMAGCLPMLIQMPIWIALYQMLWNSVELYQQPFMLWITDLTAPDPVYVLPIAMGASMFVQQAFQPTMEEQPQMKYVMWGMPFFLTFIMLNMPAGLSLYIFINNILTIFQQLFIKRRYGTDEKLVLVEEKISKQKPKGLKLT